MPKRLPRWFAYTLIGSHLCEALLAAGWRVRALDDLSVGRRENVPAGCELVEGSVLDDGALRAALEGVDAVCHEAARVSIRESVERFCEDAETNLLGTLRVLRAAGRAKVRRFVQASSMAVYADSPDATPVRESHALEPTSPYGIAKLAAERSVLVVGRALGLEPVVLRYFDTFGARQAYTPYVGVVTIFATRLLAGQPLTIFGDGSQTRDFVHVSDVAQANLLALSAPGAAGGVFNVGSGRGTTVREVAELLRGMLRPGAGEGWARHEPARGEETRHSVADVSRARAVLGYAPATDLRAQLPAVVAALHGGDRRRGMIAP
jgi:UDP-glucose 4-epimerase